MNNIDEKELIKFDKTEAELKLIVKKTSGIVKVDITNKTELAIVKRNKLDLGILRTNLKKYGKNKRDWFNDMSKKIIAREKELVKIVEDEENRLNEFLEEATQLQIKAERLVILPARKEELAKIGDTVKITNAIICDMDDEDFRSYVNERIANKNEADRLALEKQKEEQEKEKERLEWEKSAQEREKKARKEEKEKLEREEKERKEHKEREEKEEAKQKVKDRITLVESLGLFFEEEIDMYSFDNFEISMTDIKTSPDGEFAVKVQKVKDEIASVAKKTEEDAEQVRLAEKEQAEKEKLEADKKYQNLLIDNGYTEKTKGDFLLQDDNHVVTLYKLISTYKKK